MAPQADGAPASPTGVAWFETAFGGPGPALPRLAALESMTEGLAGDPAAAAIATAIGLVWAEGRRLDRLAVWSERAHTLFEAEGPGAPGGAARVAIGIAASVADQLGPLPLPQDAWMSRLSQAVLECGDDGLRLAFAAVRAHAMLCAGDFDAALDVLKEARHLAAARPPGPLQALALSMAGALRDALVGDGRQGVALIDGLLHSPGAAVMPAGMRALAMAHRLLCLARHATAPVLDAEAERLRAWMVPAQDLYHAGYVQHALSVAALVQGKAALALTLARRAVELGRASRSGLAALVPALVELQALADLDRAAEAEDFAAGHLAAWERCGLKGIAGTGWLELARLRQRRGEVAAARQAAERAVQVWPGGAEEHLVNRPHEPVAACLHAALAGGRAEAGAAAAAAPLAITTFGALEVRVGGRLLYDRDWPGARSKALLKALIVLGGRKVELAVLADMMWPDAEGDQARRNLKVALWRLRHLVGGQEAGAVRWLAVQHGRVSLLASACQVDALRLAELAAAATPAAAREAIDLYRGDFLAGDDSEPWIEAERRRLRHLFVGLLLKVAAWPGTDERLAGPLREKLEAAAAVEPTNEDLHQALMRLFLAAGQPAQAVRVFGAAEAALRDRLGSRPGAPLRRLLAQALASPG